LLGANLPFAEKRKIDFGLGNTAASKKRATYASAQELSDIGDWDITSDRQRHDRHLALLAERWGIRPVAPSALQEIVAEMIAQKRA
jgi:hypothetical protein